ncbi:MAG TPA: preprotein translocase subunit SecG [bacterium]|nr:preprotein translocase subunit SecG [bacterium]
MSLAINILFVLNAIVLIGVVLIQQPKTSGGLFSGTGQSLLGTSGKTFWTKTTIIVASIFMVLCILMVRFPAAQKGQSSVADIIEKQNQQQAAPAAAPNGEKAPAAAQPVSSSAPAAQKVPGTTGKKN